MKPPRVIWILLLMAALFCCWLSVHSLQHARQPVRILVADALVITHSGFPMNPTHATVTGIMSDPNFRAVIHALEQRSGVEKLAEPEGAARRSMWAVNRAFYDDRFSFTITNR